MCTWQHHFDCNTLCRFQICSRKCSCRATASSHPPTQHRRPRASSIRPDGWLKHFPAPTLGRRTTVYAMSAGIRYSQHRCDNLKSNGYFYFSFLADFEGFPSENEYKMTQGPPSEEEGSFLKNPAALKGLHWHPLLEREWMQRGLGARPRRNMLAGVNRDEMFFYGRFALNENQT